MKVFPREARYDRILMDQNKALLEIDMGGRVEGNLLQDFSTLVVD